MTAPARLSGGEVNFHTSHFSANVTGLAGDGLARGEIESTTTGSVWRSFSPNSEADPGTIEIGVQFDPDNPPVFGPAEPMELCLPAISGGTLTSWVFAGWLAGSAFGAIKNGILTGTVSIRRSGPAETFAGLSFIVNDDGNQVYDSVFRIRG